MQDKRFRRIAPGVGIRFRAAMPQAVAELKLSAFDLAQCEFELVAHGDGPRKQDFCQQFGISMTERFLQRIRVGR